MKKSSLKTVIFGTVAICTGVVIGVVSTISALSQELPNIKATKTTKLKTTWLSFKDWMLGK